MAYYVNGADKGKPTKKAAQRIHAKKRAQKRFRLNLTREVRGEMKLHALTDVVSFTVQASAVL